jgi:hypothetical protein
MAKTRKHKQGKQSKQPKQRKQSLKNRTPTPYPRIHQTYMNVSETWKNGQGRRNTVVIRNGKGTKRVEQLGSRGEVLETKNRPLTAPERTHILEGRFIPGLWRNCKLGQC